MHNVVITGGAGFIGANFIHFLFGNPSFSGKVLNIDKLTYAGNRDSLQEIETRYGDSRYFFAQIDICDTAKVAALLEGFQPDTIINFAAESHVDRSIDAPMQFIHTNLVGTASMLEASLKYYRSLSTEAQQSFRFHHVSTDEVFGSLGSSGAFNESTPYDPSSPYSASKAGSDHLVRAWHRTFGLPVSISNCSNNYGAYQFPEKLIPLMIINCLAHKALPVYGKGLNVRDWLYVDDHCRAIEKVVCCGKPGETYNIGGNCELQNIQIVHHICDLLDEMYPSSTLGSYRELIQYVADRPGHDLRYAIDATKIKQELGWEASISFTDGIRKTVEWYLENRLWWQRIQDSSYRQERLGLG